MKILTYLFAPTLLLSGAALADQVWSVYMFHRHGDRTAKALPPASLTLLGYNEVLASGTYYNSRYVSGTSDMQIQGISDTTVKNSQISVSAPVDVVIQSSAEAFLQGFYPPVAGLTQTLANGTMVTSPMAGYQLIPVQVTSSGAGSENNAWLQDASGCGNAIISSNNFFSSPDFKTLNTSTLDFYQRLDPVTTPTFASSYMNFKNAYSSKSCVADAHLDAD
jgi:hypothetical protein